MMIEPAAVPRLPVGGICPENTTGVFGQTCKFISHENPYRNLRIFALPGALATRTIRFEVNDFSPQNFKGK